MVELSAFETKVPLPPLRGFRGGDPQIKLP
jgi:hypothetical protein